MSVDPGTQGTGIAIWQGSDILVSDSVSAKGDWTERVTQMSLGVFKCVTRAACHPKFVFFEMPFTANNASTAKDDVVKLSIACGAVLSTLFNVYGCKLIPVPVIQWKGQLEKKESDRRIERAMLETIKYHKPTTRADHETDAIGIGLHVMGVKL